MDKGSKQFQRNQSPVHQADDPTQAGGRPFRRSTMDFYQPGQTLARSATTPDDNENVHEQLRKRHSDNRDPRSILGIVKR